MLKPLKLRTSIVLTFGGLAFLTTTLVAMLVGNNARSLAEHDAHQRLEAASIEIRNALDQDMFERFRDIKNAAALSALFTEGTGPLRRVWFDRMLATYPDYAWLGFADADGKVLTSANGVLEGQSVAARPWFQQGKLAPFVGDVHSALLLEKLLPNPSGEPMRFVDVATPVMDPDGRFAGVLGAHLSWQWARRIHRTVLASIGADDQQIDALILDRNGTVLLGPDGMVDKPLALPGLAAAAAEPQSGLVVWPDQQAYLTTTVRTAGYLDFKGIGWSVTMRQPREIAFAEAQRIQRHVLWVGLIAALLVGLIAWFLAGRLARPLTILSDAARRIGAGETEVALPVATAYFEVASLTHSFQTMTTALDREHANLSELNETLEARIAQRTATLNLMQEISAAANEASCLDEAVRFALERLCAYLRWPVGHAHRITGGNYVPTDIWFLADTQRYAPFVATTRNLLVGLDIGLLSIVAPQDEPIWVQDITRRPEFLRKGVAERCGLGAALVFPVMVAGRTELILQCYADRVLPEDGDSLEIARFIGLQLGRVAERFAAARRLGAIYDSVLDGIITLNASGSIETMNRAAEVLFGHAPDSLLRRNLRLLLAEPYASAHEREFARHIAGEPGTLLGTVRVLDGLRADGTSFPMEMVLTDASLDTGHLLVASVRDISERRAVERLKNEFVSTVSHELRTPLTSISGALALMAKGTAGVLPDKAQNLVTIARSNSDRLVRLINDILDLERIEAGNLVFEFEAVEIADLIEQARRDTAEFAAKYKVHIEVGTTLPGVLVWGDRHRLMQGLSNLMSNAIKFSAQGAAVTLAMSVENGTVRISVIDQGRGIPDSFKRRIFQKFAQADASDSRQKGGTGLGLSIVKSIVERHGGQIGFASQVGVGSTFWFDIPEQQAPATPLVANGAGRKILVCEDDEVVSEALSLQLEDAGYFPVRAHTAAEARGLLTTERFTAMTLDLGLPDQDGFAFLASIKADPATADMPVIIISGWPDIGGQCLGIADWIAKPVRQATLIAALDEIRFGQDRPRVLHVEDDPDIASLVATTLTARADLMTVGSLAQARAALEQRPFDVLVLDIGLPDGSGVELFQTLDGLTDKPRPSVILFSAQEPHPDRREEMAAVLIKSQASLDQLAELIGQELSQRRASSLARQPDRVTP